MHFSVTLLLSLASALSPALAFEGTFPLLGFSNGACTSGGVERLHLSIPGLHADDLAHMQHFDFSAPFEAAEQRVYRPYLQPSESLRAHLEQLVCLNQKPQGEETVSSIEFDDVSDLLGSDRFDRLHSLGLSSYISVLTPVTYLIPVPGADIGARLKGLSGSHIVTISSHPTARSLHTKRQMLEPDINEIEDTLERIMGQDGDNSSEQQEEADSRNQPHDWDIDDYLATASGLSDEAAAPTRPAVMYQESSASASSATSVQSASSTAPSYTSSPLPSNAALVEKYAITTPNLVFAIGLFVFVFIPLGIFSVSALSSM